MRFIHEDCFWLPTDTNVAMLQIEVAYRADHRLGLLCGGFNAQRDQYGWKIIPHFARAPTSCDVIVGDEVHHLMMYHSADFDALFLGAFCPLQLTRV